MDLIKKLIEEKDVDKIKILLNKLTYNELQSIIKILDNSYYTGESLISDKIYDYIREYINNKFPNQSLCKKIGYEPEDKIKLKYYMGSENKTYKKDNKLFDWINKYYTDNLVISSKADGISILWDLLDNKIYSRGNGEYGIDITSHFIKYFNFSDYNINLENIKKKIFAIRGELVINKPKTRSKVAGLIHSKIINKELASEIYFVSYEILDPRFSQDEQFKILSDYKIRTVEYIISETKYINYDYLNKIYNDMKNLDYEIDGLVIRNTNKNELVKSGNPDWSICYKEIGEIKVTEIIDIEWKLSKNNAYIPVAILNPVKFKDSIVKRVTCHNAKYVKDNKIGIGCIIEIIKRGEIIPKIYKIIKESDNITFPNGKWIGPDIIYEGINKDSEIQKIIIFFKTYGIKKINIKMIIILYDNGFDSILKYLKYKINLPDQERKKTYRNIINAINIIKSNKTNIPLFISSLSLPGLSYDRACVIYNNFPNFLDEKKEIDYSKIKGIGLKLSESINYQIINNYEFIVECLKYMNTD